MIGTVEFKAKAAVFDRKGATALEYALIASASAAGTLAGFKVFFNGITNLLVSILIS